ncbi:MoxR-like ATPase [Allostreptomyces psammosilenae]|uniref:MoxR-like ATPase n=1 Tax=Allostreptomyces psammosilenae TaxID=1892865 RepID=A0A853A6J3_9ACTN|nr:MoxR-like ATPase [Allostreptomyces psammosilenae]
MTDPNGTGSAQHGHPGHNGDPGHGSAPSPQDARPVPAMPAAPPAPPEHGTMQLRAAHPEGPAPTGGQPSGHSGHSGHWPGGQNAPGQNPAGQQPPRPTEQPTTDFSAAPSPAAGTAGTGPAGPAGVELGKRDADEQAEAAERARQALGAVRAEVAKAVVGQDPAVTGLVVALLCRGHVLLEGVPGVAKTLLVRSLAAALSIDSKRIQFTPDLMPGDVTGSLVYDARSSEFSYQEGPVFTNLLLADEINRTPPKTQASLLEAMEERQVSVNGVARPLPDPFIVAATQNPVEFEGTYPLPEAQLDRFLLKLILPLPSRDDEVNVLHRHATGFDPRNLAAAGVTAVAGPADIAAARRAVERVQVAPAVLAYIVDLCRATRNSPAVALGVSPRGATALLATSRAWAWLTGRDYVTPDDVKALAMSTLRHRIQLRPEAEMEGATGDAVIEHVLAQVPAPI